jgi:hypothetical protein
MKESVFMQMHNGKRTGEGSFNVALKELFYKADMKNRRKLVAVFPEFFGNEVPEFGIYREQEIINEIRKDIHMQKYPAIKQFIDSY